jgi:hypothetical protein
LLLSNTIAGVQYEIQGVANLGDTNWVSEGFVYGSELTNWTATSVAATNQPTLFLRVRSWISSDGSGLPDWWELQYFGHIGLDPNSDPVGDGWTLLQDFQNGWNPNVFYTPPAPQGLTVSSYNAGTSTATLTWLPSPGPVTGYTIQTPSGNYNISSNEYADSVSSLTASYQVRANYVGGDSAWSAPVSVPSNFSIFVIAGPQGTAYMVIPSLPTGAKTISITRIDRYAEYLGNYSFDTNFFIPVSNITNSLCLIPASCATGPVDIYDSANYFWSAQILDTNNNAISQSSDLYSGYGSSSGTPSPDWLVPPYFDGRTELKQDLIFQLRAANETNQFVLQDFITNGGGSALVSFTPNYVYEGFYDINNENLIYGVAPVYSPQFDAFLPFEDNYMFRNYVYSTADVDSGGNITTGVQQDDYDTNLVMSLPPTYQFQFPLTNGATITSMLSTNVSRWLCMYPLTLLYPGSGDGIIGFSAQFTSAVDWTLANNVRNYWGLPFVSAEVYYQNTSGYSVNGVINAGNSFLTFADNLPVYMETAQPQFQTVGYNFWNVPPWYYGNISTNPIPGMTSFSTSRTNDLLITSVGNPNFQVAGYAKLAVTNSYYSGVYGYLGQYFTNAYQIDTNGIVTTNTTGVLSPYGQFFATQPGPVALVTMPDPDTGAQGTGVVHCVSLNVDKNHDGTIDLSFNGPDVTSQSSPMEFWINNDNDGAGVGQDIDAPELPDSANEVIQSMRDLEDYARLWICGVPSGSAMDGYQVTLSFQNCVGNPSIKLFASHESDGGYGYLTNTTIAEQYVGSYMNDSTLGTVSTGTNYVFPYLHFYNGGTQCLLFEGVTTGEGELVLTITDSNSNTIAQSGVWLDLHDAKDFIEQAVITNNMSGAMSNWTSAVEVVQPAISSGLGNDTNLIVMVHGINVQPWDCLNDAETVYKRLYWSGFEGQFCDVKWPCNLLTPIPSPLTPAVFNLSEFQAYKASQAMTNYLTQLRSRFPGYRLNLLVHSQGNAVMSEAIAKGVPFDTYILTQGAIPDSSYDVNAPTNAAMAAYDTGSNITPDSQPMGYHGAYTNLTGRIVNFYNPNDPVLAIWITDQELEKPSWYLSTAYYYYNGTNSYFYPFVGSGYLVADPEESRAMVARSRTLSIGQSGPASAHGVIQSAVNLNAQFGFNDAFPGDHSAQWVWPIQTARPYFQQVLRSCLIIPAP